MGKVMSLVSRKLNRFNVENRAQRILERDKPVPAPKYESNLRDMQRALELDPEVVEKLSKKDSSLDTRLKSVYVTSQEGTIDYRNKRQSDVERPLPLERTTPEDFEYGFIEPNKVKPGCYTLRQVMQFITDHQSDPEAWTKQRITEHYRLKENVVVNILTYYKMFNVYIPDKGTKESILTQAKAKFLNDK